MNWLPISTSARTAPEFIGSEPVHRATWICLMLYCAEHETGGVLRDCASWGDRRWMQTIGVTKAEVLLETPLYAFRGADLVVWGYDAGYEVVVNRKRACARLGGLASANARTKHMLPGESGEAPSEKARPEPLLKHMPKHTLQRRGGEGRGEEIKTVPDGLSVGIGNGGDKYERLRAIPQQDLAQWAVRFCGDDLSWTRVYKAYVDKIGPEAFRAILEQFVGEVDAGEDGRVRGSVLVAKLKKAVAEKHGGSGSAGK